MSSSRDIIFGPVLSRRLGVSLGVDVVPVNVCSFDCVYCELGVTTKKTAQRKEYIPVQEVDAALEEYFGAKGQGARGAASPGDRGGTSGAGRAEGTAASKEAAPQQGHLDCVTFSSSGEPTLHSKIAHFIAKVKSLTDTPVAVLTNGSLLPDPQVREDLLGADLVVPSLDVATQDTFARMNRPVYGIKVEEIIEGIRLLAAEFSGETWLEILIVEGLNDGPEEVEALAAAAALIKPTRTQIGTVVRAPAESHVHPAGMDDLHRIASHFQGQVDVIPISGGIGDPGCRR